MTEIEYSLDNGSSWKSYGYREEQAAIVAMEFQAPFLAMWRFTDMESQFNAHVIRRIEDEPSS